MRDILNFQYVIMEKYQQHPHILLIAVKKRFFIVWVARANANIWHMPCNLVVPETSLNAIAVIRNIYEIEAQLAITIKCVAIPSTQTHPA